MKRATVAVVVGFLLALSGLFLLAFFPLRDPYVWGYWQEHGQVFSQEVLVEKIEEASPAEAERFISEVCDEPVRFRQGDETIQTMVWPDPTLVRHFFLRSPFAGVVWVTVISPQYACSARFRVTLKWHRCSNKELDSEHTLASEGEDEPTNKIICTAGDLRMTDIRLLARERRRSDAPPGMQPLMLGERVLGKLSSGESARFRAIAPDVGQNVVIDAHAVGFTYPPPADELSDRVTFSVERNGQRIDLNGPPGKVDPALLPGAAFAQGGGTFDITVHGPKHGTGSYCLVVTWNASLGTPSCAIVDLNMRAGASIPGIPTR